MATLENLVVKFTGDSSGLVTAARVGTRAVKGVGRATAQLAKIGAVGAASLAVAAGAFIQTSRQQIDETRKLAANLRQTAAETQELALVGELTGTNLQTMSIAVQQATRAVGDAQRRGGAAAEAFKALGLNVEEVARMSASVRFRTIITALGEVQDKTQAASIAAELLGRGWRTMNVLIEDGGASFNRANKVITGLGLGLKEADNATEVFNDHLAVLVEIGTALRNKVFESLVPLMVPFVAHLVSLAEAAITAAGGGQELADAWATKIVDAIRNTITFFKNLGTVVSNVWAVIKPIIALITESMAAIAAIAGGFAGGGLSGGIAATQAVASTLGDRARGAFGVGSTQEGGEVQEQQLTEQQKQTQLLRQMAEGGSVAVAG